jgi:carbon monoxide dehydrogenase subunit G
VKLRGLARLPAARALVWELLTNPEKLAKCLPGCERLEATGADEYQVAVKFGIAAISGKYSGKVTLAEKRPPASLRMKVEGKGAPGFMKGEGKIELVERNGETEVRYEGEAQVGGLIASVGQRMIEAAAKRIVQQFFDSAGKQLRNPSG